MKLSIAADWVAYDHKQAILAHLEERGHTVQDLGGTTEENNEYPEYAERVGYSIVEGAADFGILICGTGLGMSIAANKVPGVRAALCHNVFTTTRSRGHNDANVFVIGCWVVSIKHALELLDLWLETPFDGERHIPRLEKIREIEARAKTKSQRNQ
jgi:ribose 5-phosphate isomerase B